ncbi:MAG TPA: tRNA-dihydrouridine synthase, partial [Ginsengibacter sp.]|nr:tRNA-dihydrouridine synthase [Ginsengibacter sp.]
MVRIANITLPDFPLLLAPMEDVSDPPFRAVCKENGADMLYTEFISSEGLIRDAIKSKRKLDIFQYERPVGIQIFGGDEDSLAMAAKIVEVTNPDLLDINFGCPVKKVACRGAGAGVLKDVPLMVRLTEAVVKSTSLPVTVKTRLGWDEDSKNIEEVAEHHPEKIIREWVDPSVGLQPFQARKLGFALGLEGEGFKNFTRFMLNLYKAYTESDASMVEVNPMLRTSDSKIIAVDGKIDIDDNALFRHKDLAAMRDLSEEDALEVEAGESNLNYVKLEGNVGCMENGAGLAMATMD